MVSKMAYLNYFIHRKESLGPGAGKLVSLHVLHAGKKKQKRHITFLVILLFGFVFTY